MLARLGSIALLALALAACPSEGTAPAAGGGAPAASGADWTLNVPDSSEVIAKSGALTVTRAEFDAEMQAIPPRARDRYNTDKGRRSVVERILLNKTLLEEAKNRGVTDDPTARMVAKMAAEKAYVQALTLKMQEEAQTEESVKKYYEENAARYERPMVKARHILVKEKALAEDVLSKLNAGGDFEALAKEFSTDPGSKRRGGDLGWFTQERMVKPFAEAAFAAEKGKIVGPVETKFGFHVIEVTDKRDKQPLEEVRSGIERLLGRDVIKEFTDGARQKLDVELVGEFASAGEAEAGGDAAPEGDAAQAKPAEGGDKPAEKPADH